MASEEKLIRDCLLIPLWLLLLVLLLPLPVERCVLPRAVELLDFAVALTWQVRAEVSEGLAVDEKASLKPRYLFRRPVLKGVVLSQGIEQNIVGSQLIAALLILVFHLLLNQILDELTRLRLAEVQAARAGGSVGQRGGAWHVRGSGCLVGCSLVWANV